MKNIISFFPKDQLTELSDIFRSSKKISFSGVGNSSAKAMLISDLLRKNKGKFSNTVWVVNDLNEQNELKKALKVWSDKDIFTYHLRADEERLSFNSQSEFDGLKESEILEFVYRFNLRKDGIFILDFSSVKQAFPYFDALFKVKSEVVKGRKLDLVDFIQKLVVMGYEMVDHDEITKGEYFRRGDSLYVFPLNSELAVRIDVNFDVVEKILVGGDEAEKVEVYPNFYEHEVGSLVDVLTHQCLFIDDELDVGDEDFDFWNDFISKLGADIFSVNFSSFNEDEERHRHFHFMSVLKYRNAYDLANDFRDKIGMGWKILYFTKHLAETRGLMKDQSVPFLEGIDSDKFGRSSVFLVEVDLEDIFPESFQNLETKVLLLSDNDVSLFKDKRESNVAKNVFNDFLTSLKTGDFVVHADHGIAKFLGLDKKTVDGITKEYLKLGYAENDKLFVPIDQADKVNKYIGSDELMPKLTRLGSAEWNTITSKVKKETQQIAKELLKLYAERRAAKGVKFKEDNVDQVKFEATFQYEETPGQMRAINDVKADMESELPMDRLVCGDVGFGKTEVAMRAAFKAVQSQKQVALISPITILADQHYKSFKKRMEDFGVRVDMLSRFKSGAEQTEIVKKLARGEIDVIVGTHRLLQPDIEFKDLGLVVIDEEQRFGVKQKEKLKEMRKEVDILTMTATPIPRTLNICLNKLRDITTITTPPFGRLPVITEVRKYSSSLVREAIMKELARGGQVYVLHNRVQTIDSFADQLRELVPEAKFVVAHGKLGSGDLEERIMAFKDAKYDVLVSSTIIENGIDLENANTLIVNSAEKFGLAQLYQLRGRVGRGRTQAYAYFLYHGQRLKLDAKKRLRAIVEASDLGAGFQIAMKDLEIRGAGDILGANQHGVINVVGVSHFMRMLNKAVEDLKAGKIMEGEEEIEDISVELPVQAFIPDEYISSSKDKINAYQRLSSADSLEYLQEIADDFLEEYGKMPDEVRSLFDVIRLKIHAKKAHLLNVRAEAVPMSKDKEIVLQMSKKVKPANIVNLLECNPDWQITGSKLRINMQKLGLSWFDSLLKSVMKLGEEAKHGSQK